MNTPPGLRIETDDLTRPQVQALLAEHLANMHAVTPAESVHALDLEGLRAPEITFFSAWRGHVLVGCGALKRLDARHAEIKSMRTPANLRRQGAGRALLEHLIAQARASGFQRLSLETGAGEAFVPAQRLYQRFGFTSCGPFDGYADDPNSVFMTLVL